MSADVKSSAALSAEAVPESIRLTSWHLVLFGYTVLAAAIHSVAALVVAMLTVTLLMKSRWTWPEQVMQGVDILALLIGVVGLSAIAPAIALFVEPLARGDASRMEWLQSVVVSILAGPGRPAELLFGIAGPSLFYGVFAGYAAFRLMTGRT